MDNIGIFKGWVVLVNDKGVTQVYTHRGYNKIDEAYAGLFELPFEKWSVKDLSVIFENILEDRNYHSLPDISGNLILAMESVGLSRDKQAEIMRKFVQDFFS